MTVLRTSVGTIWIVFWIYWLASARGVKASRRNRSGMPFRAIVVVAVIVFARLVRVPELAVHNPLLGGIGAAILVCGLALAVWARVHLGRNWGMPMSQKDEPELVTSGPYRLVRHPIYTGLLLGGLGSALAIDLIGLLVVLAAGAYFYYAATVEERNLAATMPGTYEVYRARTKMIVPFLL